MKRALLAMAAAALAGGIARGQSISNLEAGRPVTVEDSVPIARGAFSASADYAYARRLDDVEYAGPLFALVYGAYQNLELGAESRLLTNPRLNARRGIGSGDLDLHALGAVSTETATRPSIGLRADVILPTGVASHGTNWSAEVLATKSFEGARLHGNFGNLYVGDTRPGARRNRLFAAVGVDFTPFGAWDTDTVGLADVVVRQSLETGGKISLGLELGLRRRVGMQTIFYAGMATETAGDPDRIRYRGLLGLSHAF